MHRGCFVWTPTPPLSRQRTPRPGPVGSCVCLLSWSGRAGWPPRRVLMRLTFSCGPSWCSLCLLRPLRARVTLRVVFVVFFFFFCASLVSCVSCFPALGAQGFGVLRPPPPPLCSIFFLVPHWGCRYFSVLFFPAGFCFWFLFLFSLLPFFFFALPWCAGCAVLCGGVSWAVGRLGVCCCGPCGSDAGCCAPALHLAVLAACAASICVVACCVARARWRRAGRVALPRAASAGCRGVLPNPPPRVFCAHFFRLSGVCWLTPPPPPPGWLLCRLLCFIVRCVVWCSGLWCVLCCVACLRWVGFLRRVVRRGVVLDPVFVFVVLP